MYPAHYQIARLVKNKPIFLVVQLTMKAENRTNKKKTLFLKSASQDFNESITFSHFQDVDNEDSVVDVDSVVRN